MKSLQYLCSQQTLFNLGAIKRSRSSLVKSTLAYLFYHRASLSQPYLPGFVRGRLTRYSVTCQCMPQCWDTNIRHLNTHLSYRSGLPAKSEWLDFDSLKSNQSSSEWLDFDSLKSNLSSSDWLDFDSLKANQSSSDWIDFDSLKVNQSSTGKYTKNSIQWSKTRQLCHAIFAGPGVKLNHKHIHICGSAISANQPRFVHTGHTPAMAKSKFEYVRSFETDDTCLPNTWIVVRVDGKSFHRFSNTHSFIKPNDDRSLGLMTRAAQCVLEEFKGDIILAYGQSDEYSFVFRKHATTYSRRASKLMTNIASLFTSAYVLYWPRFFNTVPLQYPPSFDGRVILYPSDQNLRDYLSWRQADCHINNLYNTCFWKLIQEHGLTPAESQIRLKGTLSSDKNELLYSDFNLNYNSLPELYRKGTVLIIKREASDESMAHRGEKKGAVNRINILQHNCDIIGSQFWQENPEILAPAKR